MAGGKRAAGIFYTVATDRQNFYEVGWFGGVDQKDVDMVDFMAT